MTKKEFLKALDKGFIEPTAIGIEKSKELHGNLFQSILGEKSGIVLSDKTAGELLLILFRTFTSQKGVPPKDCWQVRAIQKII